MDTKRELEFIGEILKEYEYEKRMYLRRIVRAKAKKVVDEMLKQSVNAQKLIEVPKVEGEKGEEIKVYRFFVTISFRDDLTKITEYLTTTLRFLKRKFVLKSHMVFEQRGKTDIDIHGVHTHFLLEANIKPCILNKYLKDAYKNCCDVNNSRFIDVKRINVDSFWNDKLEYMKGNKKDETKLDAVKMNALFRQKYNIKSEYIDAN